MMIHPLLKLAITQPHLLGEHVEAYAALIGQEAKKASTSMVVRIGLYAGAGLLALIGLVLVGVALLLRASISAVDYPAGWALLVVPLVPFVIAGVMVFIARSKPIEQAFDEVKKQVKADMNLFRQTGSTWTDTIIAPPARNLAASPYPSRRNTTADATSVAPTPSRPEPDSALSRLKESRERVRAELTAIAHPPKRPDAGVAGKLIAMVKDVPGANLVLETAQGWLHHHRDTVEGADRACRTLLKPVARQYPMSLLIGAAAAGAGLLLLRPWRLLFRAKVFFALASVLATPRRPQPLHGILGATRAERHRIAQASLSARVKDQCASDAQ